MCFKQTYKLIIVSVVANFIYPALYAHVNRVAKQSASNSDESMIILFSIVIMLLIAAIFLKIKTSKLISAGRREKQETEQDRLNQYVSNMDSKQIEQYIQYKQNRKEKDKPSSNVNNSKLLSFLLV